MDKFINVVGYPGYQINRGGEIISYKRPNPKKLKPYVAGNGYWEIALSPRRGIYRRLCLHRLLALHFLPNPNNLPQINHKDGNPLNCRIDNLEWTTPSANVLHFIYGPRGKTHRRIIVVDGTEFPSFKGCAEHFGISVKNLSSQLKKNIIPRKLRGKTIIYK